MKKTLLLSVMIAAVVTLMAQEQKEVVTGASYVNDVYYSLDSGSVMSVARENWDIAFVVPTMDYDVSILANTAASVELYTYDKGDISHWATLDTNGMKWMPMFNSMEELSKGAFNYNTIPGDLLDYGWGRYNIPTHTITGDSLYVLKTSEDKYWKIWITKRDAIFNTWEFMFDTLGGSNADTVFFESADYDGKNFVYYNFENKELLDREPATANWDLLFTKYTDYINYSPASDVSGIITNQDHIVAQEVRETALDQATFVSFEDTSFSSDINIIGYDWKKLVFNPGPSFDLIDTVVYFIKKYTEQDSAYYKLYFTGFTGMSEGKYTFMQEKLSLVSARSPEMIQMLEVYPNPASEYLNVVFDQVGETEIQVIDITGRTVHSTIHNAGGFTNLSLDIAHLNPGLFFLKVNSGAKTGVIRFIKQ